MYRPAADLPPGCVVPNGVVFVLMRNLKLPHYISATLKWNFISSYVNATGDSCFMIILNGVQQFLDTLSTIQLSLCRITFLPRNVKTPTLCLSVAVAGGMKMFVHIKL